jgi:hypothetical protein
MERVLVAGFLQPTHERLERVRSVFPRPFFAVGFGLVRCHLSAPLLFGLNPNELERTGHDSAEVVGEV